MNTYFEVKQRNSYRLTFNLVDEDNNAIQLADLDGLQLTQYYLNPESVSIKNGVRISSDKYDLQIINSREAQNALNINNVAVSATGTVTWTVLPADMAKVNSNTEQEYHIALFTWTYASSKQNSVEFYFNVRKVPYTITS